MTLAIVAPLAVDAVADLLEGQVPPVRAVAGGTPIAHLVRGLVGRGHHVTVVTAELGRTEELVLGGPGLEVRIGPYRASRRARDLFAVERAELESALRQVSPSVVHAHWTYEFAMAALSFNRRSIVTVRDWAPTILRYHTDPYRAVRLLMNVGVLARAEHLTVTSTCMQTRVRRWTRGDPRLIPNAIHDDDFAPRTTIHTRKPAGPPVVVAITNGFGRLKNVTTLLRAWPRVRRQHPDAVLELIGHGYDAAGPAAAWAAAEGVRTTGVRFLGPRSNAEAMARLGDASVLVHPSREESFGLVLVEAMARGVPVVGGHDAGAVPWILDEGRAGRLANVTDPVSLSRAVLDTLADPPGTRQRVLHAYERAWDQFRLSRTLDAYEAYYAEVGRRP